MDTHGSCLAAEIKETTVMDAFVGNSTRSSEGSTSGHLWQPVANILPFDGRIVVGVNWVLFDFVIEMLGRHCACTFIPFLDVPIRQRCRHRWVRQPCRHRWDKSWTGICILHGLTLVWPRRRPCRPWRNNKCFLARVYRDAVLVPIISAAAAPHNARCLRQIGTCEKRLEAIY